MANPLKFAAALAGVALLLAACAPDGPGNTLAADPVADSQGSVDSLTGLGESDFGGDSDVPGTDF